MKHILMLGSSHSACFSGVDFAPICKFSIVANRAVGLFRNLRISGSGHISCDPSAGEWDKTVFQKSIQFTNSSDCIHDYDAIILNIRYNLPIPYLLNSSSSTCMVPAGLISKNLLNTIVHQHALSDKIGLNGNKAILHALKSSKYKGDIHMMLTPFATSSETDINRIESDHFLRDNTIFVLDRIKQFLSDELKCSILLPSADMLDAYAYAMLKYSADSSSTWRSIIANKETEPHDRIHKNNLYALDLIKANASLL